MINDNTRDKFAAIYAAALAKENAKAKPLSKATGEQKQIPAPIPTPAEVKPATPPADPYSNVKKFDNIQDITAAANNGEVIDILNLYNIVNDKPKPEAIQDNTPELSSFTFEDICNEPTPEEETLQEEQNSPASPLILSPCIMQWTKAGQPTTAPEIAPVTPANKLEGFKTLKIGKFTFVQYSDKSFAVIGEEADTKPIKEKMYNFGGKYNYYLKCGAGYIFAIKKYYTVKTFIENL